MKKLLLFVSLCAIAGNSFGMDQQYMMPCQQNKPTASALILTGIACVGASMWYASRGQANSYNQTVTITSHPNQISGGMAPTTNTAYAINLPPRTIGALAPLIPAVFCFWYGFKNLNS